MLSLVSHYNITIINIPTNDQCLQIVHIKYKNRGSELALFTVMEVSIMCYLENENVNTKYISVKFNKQKKRA